MVLDDEQCMRFFDTMDALLYYVNERFRAVEGFTLDIGGAIDDMKAAIVARTLWENVEIIDDFVRDNPARLPESYLRTAIAWKDALPGLYTVVRYQNGRAVMMNDVGLFAVSGVSEELEHEIGPAPAYADLVLLPFDDVIVYDGFLQAYSPSGMGNELQDIQDEFENRCSQGIVSDAEGFARVARGHLQAKREEELDALLADVTREADQSEEILPEGFHRGALAGLSHEERSAKILEEFRKRYPDSGFKGGHRPGSASVALGHEAEDGDALPAESEHGSDSHEAEGEDSRTSNGPLTDEKLLEMWNELSSLARAGASEEDARIGHVMNCAVACAIYRGVVQLDEAYEQYCAVVPNPYDRDRFVELVREESQQVDAYFGLWTHQSQEYLVYFTLTPDYVAQEMSRAGEQRDIPKELEYYESYKAGLLEVRAEVEPKPLSRTLAENNAVGEVLGNPSVLRLRDFLDERIPDGEDDLLFASGASESVAWMCIETGSLEAVFQYLEETGLSRCCDDGQRLATYVTNVFNAMPSWENNGWSPQELYEKLTGRKLFFNSDGTVMKVGADDLCPCGSGLKYRECCGR